jgi:hypothetical protein
MGYLVCGTDTYKTVELKGNWALVTVTKHDRCPGLTIYNKGDLK